MEPSIQYAFESGSLAPRSVPPAGVTKTHFSKHPIRLPLPKAALRKEAKFDAPAASALAIFRSS